MSDKNDYEEYMEKLLNDSQIMLSQINEDLNKRTNELCSFDPKWRHLKGQSEVLQGNIDYINKLKKAEDYATRTESDNGAKTSPFPNNKASTSSATKTDTETSSTRA